MDFHILLENKTETEGIMAEHGLSVCIDTGDQKILFDAGASDAFAMNAERMKVDLQQVDLAVVSHGHYDHTGGFPLFCRINRKAPIYIHKNAFRESHGYSEGRIEEDMCGIRWNEEQKNAIADRLVFTDGPVWITEDIVITGTVPIAEGFEPTEKFYYYGTNGAPVFDDMSHEQCLVIRRSQGLFIFSGCSHRGAVSALRYARSLFPDTPVAVMLAGMHLYGSDGETRARVIEELKKEEVARIMPVHCTGMKAICEMQQTFGDRCIIAMAGDVFRDE
jgi:7,8-dihydropterin-6-yl-methyl-4-(beta-D-ribofuranosyl)aminobenzene 5'-phosphate synthase